MPNRPNPENARWRFVGQPWQPFRDVYPRLMQASWTVTIAWAFAAYVGVSIAFAGLYGLDRGGVRGAETMADLLWFSVQTLSTIGYGGMTPVTPFINVLVIVESFIGLAGVAVVTAILYAKFSLPEARVAFSSVLAVHDYRGVPTLCFRMVNQRTTPILDAELHVGALIDESDENQRFRRLHDVKLVRSHIPLFVMTFTAMHAFDEDSPLRHVHGADRIEFLVVTMRGVDGRTLQPVFTRALYTQEQLRWGMGFADMVTPAEEGEPATVDLRKLDALTPRPLTRKAG
jgi:inward rectifier potassium channel